MQQKDYKSPQSWYQNALEQNLLRADEAQKRAIDQLQKLHQSLLSRKNKGFIKRIKNSIIKEKTNQNGIYMYGGVGRGKSLLMDAFYKSIDINKQRVHFHSFMKHIHSKLHELKEHQDPLMKLAKDLKNKYELICFDEFHISDIADAMIQARLLKALFDEGLIFVFTSNYHPDDLYKNGLQRESFLPAIDLLKERLIIQNVDSGSDYRQRHLENEFVSEDSMLDIYQKISLDFEPPSDCVVNICNRDVAALRVSDRVIWFSFDQICFTPRSQADYLELAEKYSVVLISNFPKFLSANDSSAARRFTWLVDIFYDCRVKLIIPTDLDLDNFYVQGLYANEFHRTVSRLVEMRSKEYMALHR